MKKIDELIELLAKMVDETPTTAENMINECDIDRAHGLALDVRNESRSKKRKAPKVRTSHERRKVKF